VLKTVELLYIFVETTIKKIWIFWWIFFIWNRNLL